MSRVKVNAFGNSTLVYLLDRRCSISNNAVERAVKSYVMGRKNFLLYDTVRANGLNHPPLSGDSSIKCAGLQKMSLIA